MWGNVTIEIELMGTTASEDDQRIFLILLFF